MNCGIYGLACGTVGETRKRARCFVGSGSWIGLPKKYSGVFRYEILRRYRYFKTPHHRSTVVNLHLSAATGIGHANTNPLHLSPWSTAHYRYLRPGFQARYSTTLQYGRSTSRRTLAQLWDPQTPILLISLRL